MFVKKLFFSLPNLKKKPEYVYRIGIKQVDFSIVGFSTKCFSDSQISQQQSLMIHPLDGAYFWFNYDKLRVQYI